MEFIINRLLNQQQKFLESTAIYIRSLFMPKLDYKHGLDSVVESVLNSVAFLAYLWVKSLSVITLPTGNSCRPTEALAWPSIQEKQSGCFSFPEAHKRATTISMELCQEAPLKECQTALRYIHHGASTDLSHWWTAKILFPFSSATLGWILSPPGSKTKVCNEAPWAMGSAGTPPDRKQSCRENRRVMFPSYRQLCGVFFTIWIYSIKTYTRKGSLLL